MKRLLPWLVLGFFLIYVVEAFFRPSRSPEGFNLAEFGRGSNPARSNIGPQLGTDEILVPESGEAVPVLDEDRGLERFGHRSPGEMELAEPRWREDTSHLQWVLRQLREDSSEGEVVKFTTGVPGVVGGGCLPGSDGVVVGGATGVVEDNEISACGGEGVLVRGSTATVKDNRVSAAN